MRQPKDLPYLALGLIVAMSAVVLAWNLDQGLPYFPHPDEIHCVPYTQPDGFNHVYEGFRYPGLAKRVYSVPRILAGWDQDAPEIVLAARYLSVALSLASLVLFFELLRRLAPSAGDWIALAGVACLASHHTFVASARVALAESVLLCCALGFFLALLGYDQRPSTRRLIAAAVLLGLAIGAKYSGLFLYLPLLTAIVIAHRRDPQRLLRDAILATLVLAVVFVSTTPQLIVRPEAFLDDFTWNTQHYSTGHPGQRTDGIAWSYVRVLGVSTVLLGGLALPLWWRKDPRSLLLLVPWAVIYFVQLSGYRMAMGRNMLILLPVLLIALGQAARGLGALRPRWRVAAAATAVALVALPQWPRSSSLVEWRERPTTLDVAYGEVNALVPGDAAVWRSAFTPPIHAPRQTVGYGFDERVVASFERGDIDFLVISESFILRVKPGTFRYETDRELLRRIQAAGELALHVAAKEDLVGPGIRVYRRRAGLDGPTLRTPPPVSSNAAPHSGQVVREPSSSSRRPHSQAQPMRLAGTPATRA